MASKKQSFKGTGLTTKERNWAKKKFNNYIQTYNIEKASDRQWLEEKVFLEALQERYKKKIESLTKNKKIQEVGIIPKHFIEALDKNREQILKIDEKLGLFRDKQQDDVYDYIADLEKKAAIYRREHPEAFKTSCPFCSKIFYLKRRIDKYEEYIPPFFADGKILANKPLIEAILKGEKITKEVAAKILGVSVDYVDKLIGLYKKSLDTPSN